MLFVRYGGSIQRMLWACFNSATLGGVCVVILLLLVGGFQWTYGQCVLCVLTSAVFLLLKNLRVLVKIAFYLTQITSALYKLLSKLSLISPPHVYIILYLYCRCI